MTDGTAEAGHDAIDAAIGWHLRLPSATREEWQAFVEWLEADADHAAAYNRLTLDDALLAPSLEVPLSRPAFPPGTAVNDTAPPPVRGWRSRRWTAAAAGGAVAAALAAAVVLPAGGSGETVVETAPGARKLIAFADGSRIAVNGGSRVRLEPGNTRFAALDAGEATFDIRHDATRPFIVQSGALTLHDLGTSFNVVRTGQRLGLQVSEGAVLFEPDARALTVRPGVALDVDETTGRVEFSRVAPADVGSWRQGRLTFGADPLSDVATALGRATGLKVTVAAGLADVPFTGSVTLDRDRGATVQRLARLTGHRAQRNGDDWVIVPEGHATH